jgi:hypothetical protein
VTYPLGRVVQHDPRSRAYAIPELPANEIRSVLWTRRAPVFDQGSLGSCTGNAGAGCYATDGSGRAGATALASGAPVDEAFAVNLYSLATQLDEFDGTYPPDDTGSSGLGVAKALKKMGLATSYYHAFSIDALKSALQTGPVMWGTVWYNSMFTTTSEGVLVVDPDSGEAGGHELCIVGYNVPADMYAVANSWGPDWGRYGHCYVTGDDMAYLLNQQGDITQPTWATAPPPPRPVSFWRLVLEWLRELFS